MARFVFGVLFSIVLLLLITNVNRTNAECCFFPTMVRDMCLKSMVQICADGTSLLDFRDSYCGVGPCNLFGCDCDGGCRQNSKGYDEEEAKRLYLENFCPEPKNWEDFED